MRSVDGRTFLHLIHRYYPFRGGSEYYFQSLSEQLAADGANVHLVTTDAWDLEYFWDPSRRRIDTPRESLNGVEIHRVPVHHLPFSNLTHRVIRRGMGELSRVRFPGQRRFLSASGRFGPWLPDLPQLLDDIGQDAALIHPANIGLESMITASADFARRRDIPLVITPKLHLGESEASTVRRYYTMPHQLALLRRADWIMTQTSLEADFLTEFGIPGERISVVGLGIDVDAVTGGDGNRVRQALKIPGPMVLALGAAAYDKGTVHLSQAILEINRHREEPVTLVVAGPILSNFEHFADTLSGDEKSWIKVLGYVEDQTRTDLLAATDLVALPSRTEAFGYVFLEAWANQKPVLGARAGGIPAVIDDGVDGILVEFGDVEEIGRAVEAILDEPATAESFGRAGSRKVVNQRAWYQRVLRVYDDVLGIDAEWDDARDEQRGVETPRA